MLCSCYTFLLGFRNPSEIYPIFSGLFLTFLPKNLSKIPLKHSLKRSPKDLFQNLLRVLLQKLLQDVRVCFFFFWKSEFLSENLLSIPWKNPPGYLFMINVEINVEIFCRDSYRNCSRGSFTNFSKDSFRKSPLAFIINSTINFFRNIYRGGKKFSYKFFRWFLWKNKNFHRFFHGFFLRK